MAKGAPMLLMSSLISAEYGDESLAMILLMRLMVVIDEHSFPIPRSSTVRRIL